MDILLVPYHKDVPKSFRYTNSAGKTTLAGGYARLLQYFAEYMNYTLVLEDRHDSTMSEIHMSIENGLYNISLLTTNFENSFANIGFSYPLDWSNTCIMVPSKDELPRYWYITWPFGRYIWSLLGVTVVYVAYAMAILKHPSHSFRTNLLASMALVMFCANSCCIPFKNLSLRLQLFYFIIIMMSFIISSYYNSYLTVYNMRPIFQPFINSIDDALKENIGILISSITLEELRNNEYVNLTRLTKLLRETTIVDITDQIKKTNRSFAYVVTNNQWNFVSKLQRNLIQPVYKLSDICFGPVLNTYPVQLGAPFAHSLDVFIMRVKQFGLWNRWNDEGFRQAITKERYRILEDEYPVDPLNLYYFRIAWYLLAGGLVLSVLCFIIELVAFRYKLRFTLKCRRTLLMEV